MKVIRSFKEIKANYRDINWWNDRLAKRIGARWFNFADPGRPIWDEEWDSLIILDDCRYDLLKKMCEGAGAGAVRRWISLGNSTPSFLRRNFPDKSYPHLVYVTANPYVDKILGGRLAEIIPVWETGWDEEANTVPPSSVCEAALQAASRLDGKQLVVHFLQPHSPYPNRLGEVDFKYNIDLTLSDEQPRLYFDLGDGRRIVWPHFCWRKLDDRRIRQGYRENLELVLPHARRLADFLPGRTVITADHGEAFGERISPLLPIRVYGHPSSLRLEVTATVPWVVVEPGDKQPDSSLEEELRRVRESIRCDAAGREKERLSRRIAELRKHDRI